MLQNNSIFYIMADIKAIAMSLNPKQITFRGNASTLHKGAQIKKPQLLPNCNLLPYYFSAHKNNEILLVSQLLGLVVLF